MPQILSYGLVPEWGIAKEENSALLVSSLDADSSITTEHVQKNHLGQNCGYLAIDQESSFTMSANLVAGSDISLYHLGSQITLNNFAQSDLFTSGIGAGGYTAIIKNRKKTLSNESAVQVDFSGTVYAFGSSSES